jgi:hypothetical protein
MNIKTSCLAAVAILLVSFGANAQVVPSDQLAGCFSEEKIDGSSLGSAKKKMEIAGFAKIRDLKKGCDNFWHATSEREGEVVNIVLSPQGQVMVEGK